MKQPITFPFKHIAGGVVFDIYIAPVQRKLKDGTVKEYHSFLVCHQEGARRVPKRCNTWDAVETRIDNVVTARRKQDPESIELTGLDRRIYLAAFEEAQKLGLRVDEIVREYAAEVLVLKPFNVSPRTAAQIVADSLTKLKNVPISTAVDFYGTHGNSIKPRNVPDVVKELVGELRKNKRGDYHIGNTESRLARFAHSFTGPIHLLLEHQITEWLQGLLKIVWKLEGVNAKGQKIRVQVENDKGELVSDRTRNNYRDSVCLLFAFARRRGYISKGLDTEASQTLRLDVDPGKNHIISPEDCARALQSIPEYLVPFAVLKNFSGVRTEEGHALNWEDLRINSKAVIIEAKISKLGQRRVPPLQPNALKWLRPFRHLKGPINPRYKSSQSLYKAVKREFAKAGVVLKRNTFRNSFISYRLAQPTHSGIVADEAGTSKRMIDANYKELATKKEAKRWFSISPDAATLRRLIAYARSLAQQK